MRPTHRNRKVVRFVLYTLHKPTACLTSPRLPCLQGRVLRGGYKFQAVITTFEMILGGCPELNAIEWRCVIIDEAHRLKNKNCKLLEGFKLMNLVQKPTKFLVHC